MTDIVALLLDDDLPPDRLGEMLRSARKRRGWKRRAVAHRVGISRDELKAYEDGRHHVPADVCARLAECYGDDLTAHVPLRVPVQVEQRWMVAGDAARALPARSDEEVLRTYVELLVRLRGAKPGQPLALRGSDLAALAAALGEEPAAVEARIVQLLGCSREEAARLRSELLRRKVILPVAGLAAGVAVLAGASASAKDGAPAPATTTTPTTASEVVVDWNVVDVHVPNVPPPGAPVATTEATTEATAPPTVVPEPQPEIATPPPAPEELTDATVPPEAVEDDVPVSIPPGEVFVEIDDP